MGLQDLSIERQLRLLNMLQHGLVELRILSQGHEHERASQLADRLEIVPVYMAKWEDAYWDQIRGSLVEYEHRYPQRHYDLVSYLDTDPDPSFTRSHASS
ncbi:MAG: hypothetical protein ACAI25_06105 [Planctomycetota bacterium]